MSGQQTVYTADEFRKQIVRPTLERIQRYSRDAAELLVGTAAHETHLGRLGRRQNGGGPALGILQMEPNTWKATDKWMQQWRPGLRQTIMDMVGPANHCADLLVTDDAYAVAMGRVLYLSVQGSAIPHAENLIGLASYWKIHWNSLEGAGTVKEFMRNYHLYVKPGCVEVVN